MVANFTIPAIPLEWLGSASWRLPSGQRLAEFALQAGFLAPLMLRSGQREAEQGVELRTGDLGGIEENGGHDRAIDQENTGKGENR